MCSSVGDPGLLTCVSEEKEREGEGGREGRWGGRERGSEGEKGVEHEGREGEKVREGGRKGEDF